MCWSAGMKGLKFTGFDLNESEVTKQGPVVQSIVSLTSSLVDKMLTVLESTISNLQVFLLRKYE